MADIMAYRSIPRANSKATLQAIHSSLLCRGASGAYA
jgi:hypothetical protein